MSGEIGGLLEFLPRGKRLANYIVPGLTSTLLGSLMDGGKLRLFEMDREQEMYVVPHSHRYDFKAWVLGGSVRQYIYEVREADDALKARWISVPYDHLRRELSGMRGAYLDGYIRELDYSAGATYRMDARQYHSIKFGPGSRVLMAEGRPLSAVAMSSVLLPVSGGRVCSTFFQRDWMMEEMP